jgi:hypothetical protein
LIEIFKLINIFNTFVPEKYTTMNMQTENSAVAQTTQIIGQLLHSWNSQNKAVTGFFNKYADAAYLEEVAPGRNRAIYLLGHLVATNDGLLPLLGLGTRLYPELETLFSTNPDRAFETIPSITELKEYWAKVNNTLDDHFSKLTASDWLSAHTRVTEEDFAREPNRNKLNVLISRTIHAGYHLGQLRFLKNEHTV